MESRAKKPARLPTALGKRPPPTARVSHSYHSPCHEKKNPPEGRPKPKPPIKSVTYVPGLKCYLCSRLHTDRRMRGRWLSENSGLFS
jgi:hypothetical protein